MSQCDFTGSGVYGWGTEEEEDIWEVDLDFVALEPEECDEDHVDPEMTIGELMEWRYLRAEREKEQVRSSIDFLSCICLPRFYSCSRATSLSGKVTTTRLLNDTSLHIRSNPKCHTTS